LKDCVDAITARATYQFDARESNTPIVCYLMTVRRCVAAAHKNLRRHSLMMRVHLRRLSLHVANKNVLAELHPLLSHHLFKPLPFKEFQAIFLQCRESFP
jgi:hypothetical protein